MNIEIRKPELAQRVQAQIESGHFQDAEELIEKALDALAEKEDGSPERLVVDSDDTRTGAVLLAALQASPYRDIDIEPPRIRFPMHVRDITF